MKLRSYTGTTPLKSIDKDLSRSVDVNDIPTKGGKMNI